MCLGLFSRTYYFAFAPSREGSFSPAELHEGKDPYLKHLCVEVTDLSTFAQWCPKYLNRGVLLDESPSFVFWFPFTPYDIELPDNTPVRSPPDRCAPIKLQILKQI